MRRSFLALLVIALAVSGACFQGTEGEQGNFTFLDDTPEPGEILNLERQIDRPLAIGATMRVRLQEGGESFRPDRAASEDTGVLRVEGFFDQGVVVRGVAAGRSRLTVTRGGREDSLVLDVAGIGQTVLHLYPLGPLAQDVEGLDTTDVVLCPGARIWGFVEQRGLDGEALTGFGATPCALPGAQGHLDMDEVSDSFSLLATEDAEALTLSCGETTLNLPVVAPESATRLVAYEYLKGRYGPTFDELATGDRIYLVLLAYDADERIVQGTGGLPAGLDIPAEVAPYVALPETTGAPELDELLADSRALAVDLLGPGEHEVAGTWGALRAEITLVVAAGGQ